MTLTDFLTRVITTATGNILGLRWDRVMEDSKLHRVIPTTRTLTVHQVWVA